MTSIDPSYYLNNQPPKKSGSDDLGKDDFLKILMAQLQNQDPLDPMEDKEFVSQMAQFSSLEQMTNMTSTMTDFTESQNSLPVVQYSGLIGKEVTYPVYDEETDTVEDYNNGQVDSVSQKDGITSLVLSNGEEVSIEDITKVTEPKE
ncbi:flagellar hook assembly protein FlgD [Halobacillus sp. A5]|uniref:flagellar hook assembly protein FlgD n=1 Tax=Halobacillus sp. A5 TaxID=2880263 RepID=UPI0020A65B3B|nr:flagellar hook assembly protein FlgD [Halobacillus sp. A5]MCP3026118.1 flagellar hook assembly protein FlgD [Halobacillus sp. A5]